MMEKTEQFKTVKLIIFFFHLITSYSSSLYEHGLGTDRYTTVTVPKLSGQSYLTLQTYSGHSVGPFLG